MKFSSAPGWKRSRLPLIAMLALAATMGLAGCENDDGGVAGPPDTGSGGTGPTGPTGPSDIPISQGGPVRDIGTGSGLTAEQIADIGTLVATIDSAAVNGNKPVIEITVKTEKGGAVLGLAATTLRLGVAKLVPSVNTVPSRWQSYINRTATAGIASPALASAVQANVESGAPAGWTELGGGKYRYVSAVDLSNVTAPIAVTYEPALTHRFSIAIDLSGDARELAPDNPFKDFVPNGSPVTTEKLIAATESCARCHVRFAEHGGPRRDVEFCVVCHNPGTVDPDGGEAVDMAYMAHSIHRGEKRSTPYVVYGYQNIKFDAGDVTYPQPTTFCETCHVQSAATPQGDNWREVPSPAACGGCHDEGLNKTGPSAATGRYTFTFTHPVGTLPPEFLTFGDGECLGCHKQGSSGGDILEVHQRDTDRKHIENGDRFQYKIVKVENAAAGSAPKVTFQILQDGQPLDPRTLTTGRLRLDFAWSTPDVHNVADKAGNAYQADRGQAIVNDLLSTTNKPNIQDAGGGTYSFTLPQPLPAGFSDATLGTGLMVVLEGRRVVDGVDAYPRSAVFPEVGTGREQLVDKTKCEACHKLVYAHGGSRAGDPMICTACHNSSVGGKWISDGVTEDFGALALGAFIHGLHDGKNPAVGAVTYPQSLARCEGCHLEGKFNLARETALPVTVDAGTTDSAGATTLQWQDDLADSATAGTCKGCHASAGALDHMASQGGSFAAPKTLTPSSAVEGCAMCHAPGQTFDTAAVHCSTLPYGQCK